MPLLLLLSEEVAADRADIVAHTAVAAADVALMVAPAVAAEREVHSVLVACTVAPLPGRSSDSSSGWDAAAVDCSLNFLGEAAAMGTWTPRFRLAGTSEAGSTVVVLAVEEEGTSAGMVVVHRTSAGNVVDAWAHYHQPLAAAVVVDFGR